MSTSAGADMNLNRERVYKTKKYSHTFFSYDVRGGLQIPRHFWKRHSQPEMNEKVSKDFTRDYILLEKTEEKYLDSFHKTRG